MSPDEQNPLGWEVGSISQLVDADDSGAGVVRRSSSPHWRRANSIEAVVIGEPPAPTTNEAAGATRAVGRRSASVWPATAAPCRPGNIEGAHACGPDVPAVSECARPT